jgi:hypothetical protein
VHEHAPRLLITGMYRTGSTRVYNLLREALVARHPEARCQHFDSQDSFDKALAIPGPGIFKQHQFSDGVVQRVQDGDVQAIATVREPIQTMISLCATFGWSPVKAVDETDKALVCLEKIAVHARIHTYEIATSNNPAIVRRLLADAGIAATWPQAVRLSRRWTRERAKRLSAALVDAGVSTYDAVTLLHPGHVAGVRTVDGKTVSALQGAADRMNMRARVAALASRAT